MLCAIALDAFAHDRPNPVDPSTKFEQIIINGLENVERQRENAFFAKEVIGNARSIFDRAAVWNNKSQLNVCFWNGALASQVAVEKTASKWNGASRMTLSFRDKSSRLRKCAPADDSDIRVSLESNDGKLRYEVGQDRLGNWSLIGRQGTFIPPSRPDGTRYEVTMNLPHIADNLTVGDQVTLNFSVSHEFGHALGLLHEFQVSVCKGWIDIKSLAKDQGWTGDEASFNLDALPDVADKYKVDLGMIGNYNINSVMQYNFAQKYFVVVPGKVNPCQRVIDVSFPAKEDLEAIAAIYGSPTDQAIAKADQFHSQALVARSRFPAARKFALGTNQYDLPALDSVLESIKKLDDFERGILH